MSPTTRITGVGHAVPDERIESAQIEEEFDLEVGWIYRRTGIRERPVVAPEEATSDLSVQAARRALEQAGVAPSEIGLLLLATSTPDHLLPPSAPQVAHRLGMNGTGAVDVTGACAGFLYALSMADAFCQVQQRPVLIIGANVLSYRINPDDLATAILFSDGAGAAVAVPDRATQSSLRGLHLGSDGSGYERIQVPAGGSRQPLTSEAVERHEHLMHMKRGSAVFRGAVEAMVRSGREALADAECDVDDVDWWIPHQANQRITDRAGEELGISSDRTVSIIEHYGNSSAATIPLALSLAVRQGRIERGQTLLLTAVGAGMIEAGAVISW